jgi:amidase
VDFLGGLGAVNREVRRLAQLFERYDALVTPALAEPPPRLGELRTEGGDLDAALSRMLRFSPFTLPFNATGQPAISLPLGRHPDGMPAGVQIVGRFGDDAGLLRLAAQIERAQPWPLLAPLP